MKWAQDTITHQICNQEITGSTPIHSSVMTMGKLFTNKIIWTQMKGGDTNRLKTSSEKHWQSTTRFTTACVEYGTTWSWDTVSLCVVISNDTSFTTCYYLPSRYTGTKLFHGVITTRGCEQLHLHAKKNIKNN